MQAVVSCTVGGIGAHAIAIEGDVVAYELCVHEVVGFKLGVLNNWGGKP